MLGVSKTRQLVGKTRTGGGRRPGWPRFAPPIVPVKTVKSALRTGTDVAGLYIYIFGPRRRIDVRDLFVTETVRQIALFAQQSPMRPCSRYDLGHNSKFMAFTTLACQSLYFVSYRAMVVTAKLHIGLHTCRVK